MSGNSWLPGRWGHSAPRARRGKWLVASVVAAGVCLEASAARADDRPDPPVGGDVNISALVIVVGGTMWLSSELLLKRTIAPDHCRLCGTDETGRSAVNPLDANVRSALVWKNRSRADDISNVTGFAISPAAAFGLLLAASASETRTAGYPREAAVLGEAVVVAVLLNQTTKFIVGRERPFVAALPDDKEKLRTGSPADNNVSFYSGHSSFTFSLAVASGTIASMREYDLAPVVWGVGLGSAAATAYLRIAADKHYFTDVLVGALVGSAVGFSLPFFFHQPRALESQTARPATATPQRASFGFAFLARASSSRERLRRTSSGEHPAAAVYNQGATCPSP